jgi:integrase
MKTKVKITDTILQRWKRAGVAGDHMDSICPNLGVRVSPKGKLTFFFYAKLPDDRSPARHKLAQWCPPDFTLAKARTKAWQWRAQIDQGINPKAEIIRRKAERKFEQDQTFEKALHAWADAKMLAGRRTKSTRRRVQDIERDFCPDFGNRSMLDLSKSTAEIRLHLQKIAKRSTGIANRVHTILTSIFAWAIEYELYGLKDAVNPGMRISWESYGYKRAHNTKTITDEQICALWAASEQAGYPWGPFTKFIMLTAARHGETMLTEWSHGDFEKKCWTVPAENAKSGRETTRPLSDAALDVLKSLPRDLESAIAAIDPTTPARRPNFRRYNDAKYVFGLRPLNTYSGVDGSGRTAPKRNINSFMPEHLRDWNYHWFRHTFKTCMAKNHRHVNDRAVEMYLGHVKKKDQMDWTYNQYKYEEEMRDVAELWARHVLNIVKPPPPNVIQLKTA